MHLKESAYNFIYDDLGKDQIVFYNSRTGALAVVHEDQYNGNVCHRKPVRTDYSFV